MAKLKEKRNNKEILDFCRKVGYILIDIPATPLGLRVYAHFGQVFSFITSFPKRGGLYEKI